MDVHLALFAFIRPSIHLLVEVFYMYIKFSNVSIPCNELGFPFDTFFVFFTNYNFLKVSHNNNSSLGFLFLEDMFSSFDFLIFGFLQ